MIARIGLAILFAYGWQVANAQAPVAISPNCQASQKVYPRTIAGLQPLAEAGDVEAQFLLGDANRGGVRDNYPDALKWFRAAAAQGHADAQASLGWMYYNGLGIATDPQEALRWFRASAERHCPNGERGLGLAFAEGKGAPHDEAESARWYGRMMPTLLALAKSGSARHQMILGTVYYRARGVAEDPTAALQWYQRAAEQGYEAAQMMLEEIYHHGVGVPEDRTEATRWLKLAAEQGDRRAELWMAWACVSGTGVRRNMTEAIRWYRLSAEQGLARAQLELGDVYYYGKAVPKDFVEAAKWYRLSAEEGSPSAEEVGREAQYKLGLIYKGGEGVRRDMGEALKWFLLAGNAGESHAQVELAVFYGFEQKDYLQASNWLRIAVLGGSFEAHVKLAELHLQQKIAAADGEDPKTLFAEANLGSVGVAEAAAASLAGRGGMKRDIAKALALKRGIFVPGVKVEGSEIGGAFDFIFLESLPPGARDAYARDMAGALEQGSVDGLNEILQRFDRDVPGR